MSFNKRHLCALTILGFSILITSWHILILASNSSRKIATDTQYVPPTLKKLNNPFRCYDNTESLVLKDFYRLDCENPFLKNISLRDLEPNMDVCDIFNEPYDANDNHSLYSRIESEFKVFPSNITLDDIMEIEAACPMCHHIQLIDGQLFIVERPTAANFQTRSRSMKAMLKQVTDTFQDIGNLEMFIYLRK